MPIQTPVEKLQELLSYDPATGIITWKKDRKGANGGIRVKAGKEAGTTQVTGYRAINIDRMPQLSHRIAWALMTGEWPKNQIDHINMVRDDNRWENLRPATHSQNSMNRKAQSNNIHTKVKGVSKHHSANGYFSRIMVGGVLHYLGSFRTVEEAKAAYDKAAQEMHGNFSRT
jgi:hypothetical protein